MIGKLALAGLMITTLLAAAPRPVPRATPIPPTAANADSLIQPGETHLAHLWQLTFGGENAEGYFSSDGAQLIFQSTRDGGKCDQKCDQMYVMDLATGATTQVSEGGRTTCGYFVDDDRRILYASTHLAADSCPAPPDMSHGYVWPIYDSFDIFTARPDGSDRRRLTNTPGYDAEATVSTDGRWIVFTSVRDGDLELYRMRPDGSQVTRLTRHPGYDGGAFFSRDGKWLCWRAQPLPDSAAEADYHGLLRRGLVRPTRMDIMLGRADGSLPHRLTDGPGASFAPYFTPDGRAILYSSNRHNPSGRNFDLWLVDVNGGAPRRVTTDPAFDGFPMFSPEGRHLVFASNRGAAKRGDTNLFLAEWKD